MTRLSPMTLLPLVTFLVSAWVAAGLFYHELPDQVPIHWSTPFDRPNGFAQKPWGPFVFPLLMTAIWIARPITRRLSLRRHRAERFPGAYDFKVMLTVGLLFAIWMLVIAQSVPWPRAVGIPIAVALVVGGSFVATVPFSSVAGLANAAFTRDESDWLRARRMAAVICVSAGFVIALALASG